MENTTAVLGNFSITLPAPNGAQLSISGYVYADESLESLNARMDTCRDALLRQQRVLEVPVLKEKLQMLEGTYADIARAYEDLLQRRKRGETLSSQDKASITNCPAQLKTIEKELEKARAKIAETVV
jgi:predicted  nucleic acid-binding Zn-ribbon protein